MCKPDHEILARAWARTTFQHIILKINRVQIIIVLLLLFSIENNVCNGLQIEQTARFRVSVSVTECTPELERGGMM